MTVSPAAGEAVRKLLTETSTDDLLKACGAQQRHLCLLRSNASVSQALAALGTRKILSAPVVAPTTMQVSLRHGIAIGV